MAHDTGQNFRDRITSLPDSGDKEQTASQESRDIVNSLTKLAAYIIICPEDEFDAEGTRDKINDLCKRWINLSDPIEIIEMAEAMIESKMPRQVASTFIGELLYQILDSMGRLNDDKTEE